MIIISNTVFDLLQLIIFHHLIDGILQQHIQDLRDNISTFVNLPNPTDSLFYIFFSVFIQNKNKTNTVIVSPLVPRCVYYSQLYIYFFFSCVFILEYSFLYKERTYLLGCNHFELQISILLKKKKHDSKMSVDLNANQLQAAGELEIEMMQDLYKR